MRSFYIRLSHGRFAVSRRLTSIRALGQLLVLRPLPLSSLWTRLRCKSLSRRNFPVDFQIKRLWFLNRGFNFLNFYSDKSLVNSKVRVLLNEIYWMANDTQLKAAIGTYTSLSKLMTKAFAQKIKYANLQMSANVK